MRTLWPRVRTIRGQIFLAFMAMSIITGALGFSSVRDLEREGALVDRTYDRSLMSINFARAAAADFAGLQAGIARRLLTTDDSTSKRLNAKIAELETNMEDDLSIAVERAQSERAVKVAAKVRQAWAEWTAALGQIAKEGHTATAWQRIDRQAEIIAEQLDLLVNYTAGDGFSYRQAASAAVRSDKRFGVGATLLAILLAGSIAVFLSRRVVKPIRKASEIAGLIADGKLDVDIPSGNADEMGALLAAMEVMRRNIQASLEREVDLRRLAQTRLSDALENTCEGIVVVAPDGRIALANAPASLLLGATSAPLRVGDDANLINELVRMAGGPCLDDAAVHEIELAQGRWLQISRRPTHEGGAVFVYSDVSVVIAQKAALKNANLWLDAAMSNLTQGLCLFDASNRLRVINQRFCELFGVDGEAVQHGMTFRDLEALGFGRGIESQSAPQAFFDRVRTGEADNQLLKTMRGQTIAVLHRALSEGSWLATFEDVTDRIQAEARINHVARHDFLTGLANRTLFAERIGNALDGATRGDRFALLCLDLDHFKEVNDTLGHPIGDELLRAVAARLNSTLGETDIVARLGGDEFAVVQTHIAGPRDALVLAQRIVSALAPPFEIDGNPVTIGVSIGISLAPTDGTTYDELLKSADTALYRAKADGRNGWRFFERAMDEHQQARRLVELDLRDAVARDQFELAYQPIFDVTRERVSSFEALIRWRHPARGLVPPMEFIPAAESMGLITQIGAWVLQRACQDAAAWPSDIRVAVNVSAAQLRDSGLQEAVVSALGMSGLDPHRLTLEITESVLIANARTARAVLDRFKAMGIGIAMDDFGTGYSSLSYLRNFPFDTVKIDKSFISEVATSSEAAAIVRAIISLCASLGIRSTAEGIETEAQLAFVAAENCDEVQGFLLSMPIGILAIPTLLASGMSKSPIARLGRSGRLPSKHATDSPEKRIRSLRVKSR